MTVGQRITGAVQTDNQTITDQHVFANAFKFRYVFDARSGMGGGRSDGQGDHTGAKGEQKPLQGTQQGVDICHACRD